MQRRSPAASPRRRSSRRPRCGSRSSRRGGTHLALLHRSIEDIRAACDEKPLSCPQGIFAITEEALDCPASLSPGARNLVRAGFQLADVRALWRPPEELVAEEDDADEDDWDDEDAYARDA